MKKALLALGLVLGLGLTTTSCLGPNRLFNGLHEWNEGVTDNRWVNEGVFLGLNIIPVYGVTYLVDIVVFNSIEWWTGEDVTD